ncbi:MAG: DUF29 domain-containing protein, partial [Stellaceae bacterium]
MSGNAARLYEEDFVRWAEQQSRALREAARIGSNLPLDWDNLAEEVESLGRSQKHALRSRIAVILEHLLKLEYSPATEPRRSWMDTVARERLESELLLDDSPSLKGEVGRMTKEETSRAARHATSILLRHNEATPETVAQITGARYTENQVLGDWFPGDPPPRRSPRRRGEKKGAEYATPAGVLLELDETLHHPLVRSDQVQRGLAGQRAAAV